MLCQIATAGRGRMVGMGYMASTVARAYNGQSPWSGTIGAKPPELKAFEQLASKGDGKFAKFPVFCKFVLQVTAS